jgi:hypothetical protein
MKPKTAAKIKKYSGFLWRYIMDQRLRLAYIGGFYDLDNLGDEAVYESVEALFHRCSLLKFPRKPRLVKIARRLISTDYGVLAAGTLINQQEIWRHLAIEYMEMCPNFFIFGTGVGHPAFWPEKRPRKDPLEGVKKWKPMLEKCNYIGVRGPLSAELLTGVGIKNVDVIGDPVLAFAPDNYQNCDSYVPNSVGLNIGWDRISQWGQPEQIYTECARLASFAKKAGWRVKWFVLWPPDLAATREVARMSDTEDEIYELYSSASKYIELVKSLSTFVGTRLHSVALATCAYVPSIMLEYRPKCRDYMMSIGQEDSTVRTDKFKAEDVWNTINAWNSRRGLVSKALCEAMKPLRNKQRLKADELMKTMLMLSERGKHEGVWKAKPIRQDTF